MLTRQSLSVTFKKLKEYRASADIERKQSGLLLQFKQLNELLPAGEAVISPDLLNDIAASDTSNETGDEKKASSAAVNQKVAAIRSELRTIMAKDTSNSAKIVTSESFPAPVTGSTARVTEDFYDLVFELQLGLCCHFPTNNPSTGDQPSAEPPLVPPEKKYDDPICLEEITPDSKEVVVTSQGLLYFKSTLEAYLKTNNAYTPIQQSDSFALSFPDRYLISWREYYSLLKQGVVILPPSRDALVLSRTLGRAGEPNTAISYTPLFSFPCLYRLATTPQQVQAYELSDLFAGLAFLGFPVAAVCLCLLKWAPPNIALMLFCTAAACSLFDNQVRGQDLLSSFAINQFGLVLCFCLVSYVICPYLTPFLHPLLSPAMTPLISLALEHLDLLIPALIVQMQLLLHLLNKSLSAIFAVIDIMVLLPVYASTHFVSAIVFIGAVKFAESVCQLFSLAQQRLALPSHAALVPHPSTGLAGSRLSFFGGRGRQEQAARDIPRAASGQALEVPRASSV